MLLKSNWPSQHPKNHPKLEQFFFSYSLSQEFQGGSGQPSVKILPFHPHFGSLWHLIEVPGPLHVGLEGGTDVGGVATEAKAVHYADVERPVPGSEVLHSPKRLQVRFLPSISIRAIDLYHGYFQKKNRWFTELNSMGHLKTMAN